MIERIIQDCYYCFSFLINRMVEKIMVKIIVMMLSSVYFSCFQKSFFLIFSFSNLNHINWYWLIFTNLTKNHIVTYSSVIICPIQFYFFLFKFQ